MYRMTIGLLSDSFNSRSFIILYKMITDINIRDLEIYNLSLENVVKTNLYKLLLKNNYRLINWINSDLIFLRNTSKLKLSR